MPRTRGDAVPRPSPDRVVLLVFFVAAVTLLVALVWSGGSKLVPGGLLAVVGVNLGNRFARTRLQRIVLLVLGLVLTLWAVADFFAL